MAVTQTADVPASSAPSRARLSALGSIGLGAAGLLVFLLIWQAVPTFGLVNPMMLPGPLAIPEAFRSELDSGMWLKAVTGSLIPTV
jgi:NitT/TauT family transport system permease protein